MPNFFSKSPDTLAGAGLGTLTQAAIGLGIGLLVAGKIRQPFRRITALTMFSLGLASTLPMWLERIASHRNRPESERGMRRRLESIRDDSGFSQDEDIF